VDGIRLVAVLAFAVLAAAYVAVPWEPGAFSLDDYEDDEEEYFWGGEEEEWDDEDEGDYEGTAEELGSAAFYGGIFFSGGYVAFKYAATPLRVPPRLRRLALDVHGFGNLALAPLALIHGYLNIQYATVLEYAMAALIVFLTVSGLTLRYVRNRRLKLAARLVHGQRILALALLVLAVLHVARVD